MRANPGGNIAPEDVVGREILIERLWEVLDRQSLILTAERRMGKTSVAKKMLLEPKTGFQCYYRDLEHVHTAIQFAEIVFEDVENHLTKSKRVATHVRQFLSQYGNVELKGFKFPEIAAAHWRELLIQTIRDLAENQNEKVVFFWDEMPWMIDNIKNSDGERVAMQLLDTLRSLRQTHRNLRMVFTGSIGLHHILASLKEKGYANAPVNDMFLVDVDPLEPLDAQNLASLLLQGEGIETDCEPSSPEIIANSVDNMAFYIQHIIDQLAVRHEQPLASTIDSVVVDALTGPHDPWDMLHFRTRIDTYYKENSSIVLIILDILCRENSLSFNDLFNRVQSQITTAEIERVRSVVSLIQRDHYVQRNTNGNFSFRFPLIRRWWQLDRGV